MPVITLLGPGSGSLLMSLMICFGSMSTLNLTPPPIPIAAPTSTSALMWLKLAWTST
jgi:hypothetical protein